ncbi:MAG: hypothetical protein LJE84_01300 [Gammaproteobacteria bacterium]|jgi:predicted Zn-dependent protease|nr:hypothetical protein [Gammaproteobacteria bacterium]
MESDIISNLEKLLASGRDDALLRFGLGQALLSVGRAAEAAGHLAVAVQHDAEFSAAWKLLGRARQQEGKRTEARAAFSAGIAAAKRGGDRQAEKEMGVFLRRLEKAKT